MVPCPACATPVPDEQHFCGTCGIAVGDISDTPTGTAPRSSAPAVGVPATPPRTPTDVPSSLRKPTSSASRGRAPASAPRFTTGEVLAGRYRIIDLLGRGGMGEVYRADDVKVGQTVALKLLPSALEADAERLERFFGEVRTARQVTHPAVCRVYDVGEADGRHFLSMEYVDGETLQSLQKRIGHLPQAKALDLARQLAAGLGAAHARGVLHRDLKPANLMIDGEGRVRILDFGLAGLAESFSGDDVRSGTPAYMSPEQLAGREVTARSDVYSLGLLLFELFTGRRAFLGRSLAELMRQHREEPAPSPSAIAPEIDPSVERVILSCLEKEPERRPASALVVSALLSGAEALTALQEAGETPTPEMVAAAGMGGGLSVRTASVCLATVLAAALAAPFVLTRTSVPIEKDPAVLRDRAQILFRDLGYREPAVDSVSGLSIDRDYIRHEADKNTALNRWEGLRAGVPPVLRYWYREAPRPLVPMDRDHPVSWGDPPLTITGMIGARYDLRGRLVSFHRVPPQLEAPEGPVRTPDWDRLFAEARLDRAAFVAVTPKWIPTFYCDSRMAWEGAYPERPEVKLRIEAAAYRGRPVWFHFVHAWNRADRMERRTLSAREDAAQVGSITLVLLLFVGAVWLARRNVALGRGDRHGAFRLAAYTACMALVIWALVTHHVRDLSAEFSLGGTGIASAFLVAIMVWGFYLALEPYARRHWPHSLISWARLLTGRVSDPRVGRDLLLGATCGIGIAVIVLVGRYLPAWVGTAPPSPIDRGLEILGSTRTALAFILGQSLNATVLGLGVLLLVTLVRLAVRNGWVTALLVVAVLSGVQFLAIQGPWWGRLPLAVSVMGGIIFVLLRIGLLATMALVFTLNLILGTPYTLAVGSWMGTPTVLTTAVLGGMAVWAFRAATLERPRGASDGL